MNSDAGEPTGRPGNERAQEQPIRLLLEQEWETPLDFIKRIRAKIQRRTAASQLASFSWNLPKAILIELAGVLGHLFTTVNGKKESER
jgi:hypothetical protein